MARNWPMQKFIFEANIAHFKRQIDQETDPKRLQTLHRLLADEEAKLADHDARQRDGLGKRT
jgi:hypothetical protein